MEQAAGRKEGTEGTTVALKTAANTSDCGSPCDRGILRTASRNFKNGISTAIFTSQVIATMHQPSASILFEFDELLLLTKGKLAYAGARRPANPPPSARVE